MNEIVYDAQYIQKAIDSCETIHQLLNCRNLIDNLVNKYIRITKNVMYNAEYLNGYLNGKLHTKYGKDLTH